MNKLNKGRKILIRKTKNKIKPILVRFPRTYEKYAIFKKFIKDQWEKKYLYKYPIFVSYPRSGSHWINSIMELYFDKPRARHGEDTYLNKYRNDWMWVHDHDLNLKILNQIRMKNKFKKILFLYRNPIDVLYSSLSMMANNPKVYGEAYLSKETAFSEEVVKKNIKDWIDYHKKYFEKKGDKDFTFIRYENFIDVKKRDKEFEKICNHFSVKFDKDKIEKIFDKYGKKKIAGYRTSTEKQYMLEKSKFVSQWDDYLKKLMKKNGVKL